MFTGIVWDHGQNPSM